MSDVLLSTAAQYIPAAASHLAGGGVGLLSGYMNFMYNRALAAEQNKYNLQMWNLTNEYNSPQAQMQRFKEAGLNPNLIYGKGDNGNASGAPQMVVPNAPSYTKGMKEMAEAFNIENLRTTVANRKKAEEEAKQSHLDTKNKADEREAIRDLGYLYNFDPSTGRFVYDSNPINVTREGTGEGSTRGGRMLRYVSDNYIRTSLIPYRSALLEQQKNYLVPQVSMANYESKYFPVSYWIGTGSKAAKGINDIVGIFNPIRTGFKRPPLRYQNTYNYFNY